MVFEVSVIIPVFNAECFIEKAIYSALQQDEVKEVIVVNDGSTDSTLEKLQLVSLANPHVVIVEHQGGQNLGRSASRNLGIKTALSKYVAFLDADDYYRENRFKKDKLIFDGNPKIDGVYNAIGVHFYRRASLEEERRLKLTTIDKRISPESLFFEMWPKGHSGSFSGDGLTVKKSIFKKVGYFHEALEVAEDTHMWIRMSLKAVLVPGIIDFPVGMRGVHQRNVFNKVGQQIYISNYYKMYLLLLDWGFKNKIHINALDYFWERTIQHFHLMNQERRSILRETCFWFHFALKYPKILLIRRFLRSFPLYKKLSSFK